MGKRSNFPRIPQDKYMTTDLGPVQRLQPFLPAHVRFAEPCAGNGDLIEAMEWHGHRCVYACDINPGKGTTFEKRDLFTLDKRWRRSAGAEMFVTNTPWLREVLHPMIDHLTGLLPTWLLLDSDWSHTDQALPYLDRCRQIVALGRVKWFQGSAHGGFENAAWYLFDAAHSGGPKFAGRS